MRLAAALRSAVLLLAPLRGTATDARVLLEPELEFGSCIARLFGVMRVRSPDGVARLPPSLGAGRDAVAWLVGPWLVVGCSRRGAATREDPLLSCADGDSRMIRDEPGVMRVDSRITGDDPRLADDESRPLGDDCRTTGDESRITGDDDSRRGDAATRELSPRDTLDGADRTAPDDDGARDGPESPLGVARGADGAEPPPPPPDGRAGADGADAEPEPDPPWLGPRRVR